MGRFSEPRHPAFTALDTSLGFDRELWPYDVAQSRAHAGMLAERGIISEADRDALHAALELRDPDRRLDVAEAVVEAEPVVVEPVHVRGAALVAL